MSDQQASDVVRKAGRQAKSTLVETADRVQEAAMEAGGKAQEFARDAGRQAGAAAQGLYGQGNVALDIVERAVVENPWGAILVAGALGYGLACLVKRR
jgi:ElaB/YqjD/DUF883 family membrane-anchored ribosome-binding protein